MFDFRPSPDPATLGELWGRLVRLVASMFDSDTLKDVPLNVGHNLIPHFKTRAPKGAVCQLVGTSAGTAITTVDPAITDRFITIYATVACVVNVRLDL